MAQHHVGPLCACWLGLSALILAVLAAPYLLPHPGILSAAARLSVPHEGGPCMLCGMTRAFLAISNGEIYEGLRCNPASVKLYAGLVVNEAAALFLCIRWARRGSAHLERRSSYANT